MDMTKEQMYIYLMLEYCDNDEERREMKNWIYQRGLCEVFRIIKLLTIHKEVNKS